MKKVVGLVIVPLMIILGVRFVFTSNGIKQSWVDKGNFELMDMKADKVSLIINGKDINLKNQIFLDENRYYIPLTEITNINKGTVKKTKDSIKLNLFDKEVTINKNHWSVNDEKMSLKKHIVSYKGNLYISLIDFTNIFDLGSRWDFEGKVIKLYGLKNNNVKKYSVQGTQEGALRFEDVAVDGTGNEESSKYLEGLRYMGKNLGESEIPYYIAWIPRYIDPTRNIDLDPSKVESFPLAELVYTLDYLNFNNGYVGLHGYTHQRNNEVSGVGTEFGKDYSSVEELNIRVKKALAIAEYLDIDITFFEAPHYVITVKQNGALENKFTYIFNNYNCEIPLENQDKIIKSKLGNESYYIPTPLYYVEDGTGEQMIRRIDKLSKDSFAGFFYHPFVELNSIEFSEDNNGIPTIKYKEQSPLNKIIEKLEKKNIRLIRFH